MPMGRGMRGGMMSDQFALVFTKEDRIANPYCIIPADESSVKVYTETCIVTVHRTGRIEVEPRDE